jgi:hypothetical protein
MPQPARTTRRFVRAPPDADARVADVESQLASAIHLADDADRDAGFASLGELDRIRHQVQESGEAVRIADGAPASPDRCREELDTFSFGRLRHKHQRIFHNGGGIKFKALEIKTAGLNL